MELSYVERERLDSQRARIREILDQHIVSPDLQEDLLKLLDAISEQLGELPLHVAALRGVAGVWSTDRRSTSGVNAAGQRVAASADAAQRLGQKAGTPPKLA